MIGNLLQLLPIFIFYGPQLLWELFTTSSGCVVLIFIILPPAAVGLLIGWVIWG